MLRYAICTVVVSVFCTVSTPTFAQLDLNCANDSMGLIPLVDMGFGYYGPYKGGLYPGFSNEMPLEHLNKGKDLSNSMVPLDSAGNENWETGQILFIGMGGSSASNAFNTMVDTLRTYDWEGTNPCLKVKGLFYGGKDLQRMIDTLDTGYWDFLQDKLDSRGDSWDQVQIVWMLTHSEMTTDDSILFIKNMIGQYTMLLQRMQDSMSNLKQVFFSGFHYTGYTHPSHDLFESLAEPKAYWGNIAIKMLIERQINGDPELAFEGPGKKVPFIAWGPYFWADGNNPRGTDSLTWSCEEYRDDDTGGGFHLEDPGKWKEASMLMDFLETNEITSKWYPDAPKWINCDTTDADERALLGRENPIRVFPNPAGDYVMVGLPSGMTGDVHCRMLNSNGALVLTDQVQADINRVFSLDLRSFPKGIYVMQLQNAGHTYQVKFVVQ